jgi:hypothetical protein
MGNAIKFTERGSVSVHVRYQREIAHIEVSDTGIASRPTTTSASSSPSSAWPPVPVSRALAWA